MSLKHPACVGFASNRALGGYVAIRFLEWFLCRGVLLPRVLRYVLGVPYSCGVVLVFLVLAGNSFWCYVRVVLLCQFLVLAGNRQFFCCGGKVLSRPEKKSSSRLSGGLCYVTNLY